MTGKSHALVLAFVLGVPGTPLVTEAQQAGKVYRVGILSLNARADSLPLTEALERELRDRGYVEGRNITLEYRFAERRIERLPAMAAELVQLKVDLILAANNPQAMAARQATTTIPIVKNRLPAVYPWREAVDAGGLLSYGPDFSDLARRAATYIDKILQGARPGDLPMEQPTKFELVVNLRTAKTLGLTIPPSILARVDHIVE